MRNFVVILAAVGALTLTSLSDAASGRIYKTVDENGDVVFTDIPPKEGERSEAVAVETPNTFEGQQQGAAAPGEREQWIVDPEGAEEGEEGDEEDAAYRSLTIASPGDDEAVRENAGNVTIITRVDPELKTGHRIRVLLDGTPEQEGPQTSFLLTNVDRGTHAVSAEIVDDAGNVLLASSASTFHLLRAVAPRPTPTN